MQGNVVLWKPSDTSVLSSYVCYKILREAGVPAGVINFVPSNGPLFGSVVTRSPLLAGINFTGSARSVRGEVARDGVKANGVVQTFVHVVAPPCKYAIV